MIRMTRSEQERAGAGDDLHGGAEWEMARGAAAAMLGISARQMRRVLAAYRQEGLAGVVYGNRGRPPCRRCPPPSEHGLGRWQMDAIRESMTPI
jgi:hypothetical protein